MNATPPRASMERFALLLAEYRKREARRDQSARGWYDDNGVRQGGLIAFVRYFWHVLEPETKLVDGWVLWAIVEHLESATFGEVTRLLINVPPGCMKSMLVDVFWPAWEWGPMNLAHLRYVAFSYSASLTERDNTRFRDVVMSPEYQALWGDRVKIEKEGETKISNKKKGWKIASSVGGVGTGERGNRVILDDPHNVKQSESDTVRSETVRWFREAMSNRLNDLECDVIVIIMQRVHDDDVSGAILDLGLNYVHLCIPYEYEWDRQTDENGDAIPTDIGWIDPRHIPMAPDQCDGEPAWSERFPEHIIAQTKLEVGPYAWSSQYQQSPTPRGGGIIKRIYWQLWQESMFPAFEYVVASLDGAFTEKEYNDPSALTVWGVFTHPQTGVRGIMLIDAWRKWLQMHGPPTPRNEVERLNPGDTIHIKRRKDMAWKQRVSEDWGLVEWVAYTCRFRLVDKLLIENKASGITAAQELQRLHGREGWAIQLCPAVGDKTARLLAVQPTFSQLMVYAPAREWSEMTIDEVCAYPFAKYKDLTDSTSQAIKHLRDTGLAQHVEEVQAEAEDRVRHRPKQRAIYPC